MSVERQEKISDDTCNGHTFLVLAGDHRDSICPASLFNHVATHAPPLPLGQVWTTPFHSVPTKNIYSLYHLVPNNQRNKITLEANIYIYT